MRTVNFLAVVCLLAVAGRASAQGARQYQYSQITVSLNASCAQVGSTSGLGYLTRLRDAAIEDARNTLAANRRGIISLRATLNSLRASTPTCTDVTVSRRAVGRATRSYVRRDFMLLLPD
jgi:hypothetical protein